MKYRDTKMTGEKPTAVLLCVLFFVGCATIDPKQERQEQTQAFTEQLQKREAALPTHPLSIDDCVRIAMTNNYTIRMNDLDTQMAKLKKNVAFSAFLPQVASSYGYTTFDTLPASRQMDFQMASASLSMPLFAPTTWFLYGAVCDGYASAEIAAAYTRQNIVLQTSINYYRLLLQIDTVRAIESQLIAAQAVARRVDGLAAEGFVAPWERSQAHLLVALRTADLSHAQRQVTLMNAQLLQTLGLSPLTHITLSSNLPEAKRPEGGIEQLVLQALEKHPELSLADRMVVAHENQVRQAFAQFVPAVGLAAQLQWADLSSLSAMIPQLASSASAWTAGFSAAWTIFSGFANYNNYQISKVGRTKSELEREATFLSIIVRVVTAESSLHDAVETRHVAANAYVVAKEKSADYDAKATEGLLPQSDALDARAAMDEAQIQLLQTTYLERIAIASLELAMGITAQPAQHE